ncbi:tyrosine decarboxylase 1-like [Gossypium australe]|uniref:Tyrosine decarboxylase 1-like n=1 Tax=Gossypium australe TaxID=47621 RepID=A0A5B6VKB9_9ROSI|nr:tyrosine decarboxylase 1-like [Gossypium australe]
MDEVDLKQESVNFYKNLYGEQSRRIVSNEEIKKALFYMAPLNTPGSDGLHWELVGPSICEWIKRVFSGETLIQTLIIVLLSLYLKCSIRNVSRSFALSVFVLSYTS